MFSALERIPNPFLLCHIVRMRARVAMQRPEVGAIGAINSELAGCRVTDARPPSLATVTPSPAAPLIFSHAADE